MTNEQAAYFNGLSAGFNSRIDNLIADKATFCNLLDQFSNIEDDEKLVFFVVVLSRLLETKGLFIKSQAGGWALDRI